MTLILVTLTLFFFFYVTKSKRTVVLNFFAIGLLFSSYVIGNDSYFNQNEDSDNGLHRNLSGIINMINSDEISEENTLYYSAYLLIEKFQSPLWGNGKAYRNNSYYGHSTDTFNEFTYRTDARLAFMLVEYGLIGLGLYLIIYIFIFKECYKYSAENKVYLYLGAGIYFLLFSLTDNGFWDYIQFPSFLIYVYSKS